MTQQLTTNRAKRNRGAQNLARPPGPVQLAAHRQSKLHVIAPGLSVQSEVKFCSGEQVSVETGTHATGQALRDISLGTVPIMQRGAQTLVVLSAEARARAPCWLQLDTFHPGSGHQALGGRVK